MALSLFWLSLALMLYVLMVYPLIVAAWARIRPRPVIRDDIEPFLTIVIAAHNEAVHIGRKIANLLQLDYPADRLEVMVGSDGSTDGTLERLRAVSEQHIRIFILPERQGKPAVLNKLVPQARGEIVVLADVRQEFDPQVLRNIVKAFADPGVGAVSGELVLTEGDCSIGDGAGKYWQYEKRMRCWESRIDSTVGATGAIYAIRKALFQPLPEDTVLDDVWIPVRIVRQGYRVLFEPSARACDRPPDTGRQEFRRKVRTLAGNFQLFSRERWLLNPFRNRLWWQTVSHKFLRLFFPILQGTVFLANIFLAGHSTFYRLAFLAQLLFYLGALAGLVLQYARRKFWLATLPYTFCLLSWATVVGFFRHITRRQRVTWEKATILVK